MNPFRNFPFSRLGGTGRDEGEDGGGEGTERERGPSSSRFLNFVPVRPYESNWNRKAIITPS